LFARPFGERDRKIKNAEIARISQKKKNAGRRIGEEKKKPPEGRFEPFLGEFRSQFRGV
jgi:hypothetical protein